MSPEPIAIRQLAHLSAKRELLHIVGGYSLGGTLRSASMPSRKEIVVWWDNPSTGPTADTLEETTRLRTRAMRQPSAFQFRLVAVPAEKIPPLRQRDRLLRSCGEWREVALWFGPPAIDQFPLLQILAALSEQNLGRTRLTEVSSPKHAMGVYRPEELATFFEQRATVSSLRLKTAATAWQLYGSSNPLQLFRFALKQAQSNPALGAALIRKLQEYPSMQNGLSLCEQSLLANAANGTTVARAVGAVIGDDEVGYLTGDDYLWEIMWRFLHGPKPLIEPKGGSLAHVRSGIAFRKLDIQLTATGSKVLENKLDVVQLNGVDRWLGGVHLKGRHVAYRWDVERHELRKSRY